MTMTRRKFSNTALSAAALVGTGTAAKAADVDVIVIGAGTAGLAATDALTRAGHTAQCIEAADRIGGRVHTDLSTFDVPFDHGAHWLHNRRLNPFVDIGKALDLNVYQAPWNPLVFVKGQPASERLRSDFDDEVDRVTRALTKAAKQRKDVSGADAVTSQNPWTLTAFAHIGSLSMARDMAKVSAMDWYSVEEGTDWFCREGFGTLLSKHHAKTPVTLNARATSIDASTGGVTVRTTQGTLHAKAAIVTVSQGVLASGKLRFKPDMESETKAAIKGITMGSYNHIALQFKAGTINAKPDSWVIYQLSERQNGGPKSGGILANTSGTGLCSFEIGGSFGQALERQGESAMIDFALSEMADLFGANIHKGFIKGAATRWGKDPNVRGSYSGALPGKADTRRHLRTPIADRIFLAGEATSFGEQTTVSGAHKEGLRAAATVADMLD